VIWRHDLTAQRKEERGYDLELVVSTTCGVFHSVPFLLTYGARVEPEEFVFSSRICLARSPN